VRPGLAVVGGKPGPVFGFAPLPQADEREKGFDPEVSGPDRRRLERDSLSHPTTAADGLPPLDKLFKSKLRNAEPPVVSKEDAACAWYPGAKEGRLHDWVVQSWGLESPRAVDLQSGAPSSRAERTLDDWRARRGVINRANSASSAVEVKTVTARGACP